ncbi:hypothetical protein GCM10009558_080090 [Virgisporangium aurantiacum]
MLSVVARLSVRRPVLVVVVWLAAVAGSFAVGTGVFDRLVSDVGQVPGSESDRAADLIDRADGPRSISLSAIVYGAPVTDPALIAAVDAAIADVKAWRDLHKRIRELDDSGQYPEAVKLAVGTDDAGAGGIFNRVDEHLAQGLRHGGDMFDREVASAGDGFGGVAGGLGFLTALILIGVVVGMAQRVMEYR